MYKYSAVCLKEKYRDFQERLRDIFKPHFNLGN